QVAGVEAIVLIQKPNAALNTFNLTLADNLVAAGGSITVYGVQVVNPITLNGSAETDGSLRVFGGHGADLITTGAGADWIFGGDGGDTLTGGAGADTFFYQAASESSSTGYDTLVGFNFAQDRIDLPGVHDTYGYLSAGSLSTASFDANLATALA